MFFIVIVIVHKFNFTARLSDPLSLYEYKLVCSHSTITQNFKFYYTDHVERLLGNTNIRWYNNTEADKCFNCYLFLPLIFHKTD